MMTALDDLATVPFHDADEFRRARMLSRLADTELFAALTKEPSGDLVELQIFALEQGPVALACDSEDRLAGFFGASVAYAAIPGRVLAGLLRGDGAGLLVNPGHPSEMLLDAATLEWLTGALTAAPEPEMAHLRLVAPSAPVVTALAEPLAERLADLRGLITGAALAGVLHGDTPASHVLIVAGAAPDHQPAIAKAMAEALAFLPQQPGGVDISFSENPPASALQFDLSVTEVETPERIKLPPRLRW